MGATPWNVLSWNGTTWLPTSLSGSGSVTSVATGSGLSGGPITSSGTISIAPLGVTTAHLNDEAVTSSKLSTASVTAGKLHQMSATSGQVLKWNGLSWAPSSDSGLVSETDPTVMGFAKYTPPSCLLVNETLRFDALLNSGAGGFFCEVFNSDDVPEGASNLYFTSARAKSNALTDAILNGVTDLAPSQNAVFDALGLKQDTISSASNLDFNSLGLGTSTPGAKLGIQSPFAASSGTQYGVKIEPTVNQSGSAGYTALYMNVTKSAAGSGGKKLIDLQVDGVSKFTIDETGQMTSNTTTNGTTANFTSASGNQFTVGFDPSNKFGVDVNSLGFTTFNSSGVGAGYNFSGGNVGVGVLAPSEALDVQGSVRASVGVKAPLVSNASDLTLTADSDNNTSGALIFNTGATERARILNNGNVGIGTSAPAFKLHINGESAITNTFGLTFQGSGDDDRIYKFSTNVMATDARWFVTHGGSVGAPGVAVGELSMGLYCPAAGTLGINTNGLERARIDSAGNMAIGITNPLAKLDVAGSVGLNDNPIRFRTGNDDNWQMKFGYTHGAGLEIYTAAGNISFNNNYSPTSPTMLINTNTRNVGIGTTAPSQKLVVEDATSTAGALNPVASFESSVSSGFGTNQTGVSILFRAENGSGVQENVGSIGGVWRQTNTPNSGDLVFLTSQGGSLSEIMRLTGYNKNVGIGTTSPTAKFDVIGPSTAAPIAKFTNTGSFLSNGVQITTGSMDAIDKALVVSSNSGTNPLLVAQNSGEVGIGTTTPAHRLDVAGDVNVSGSFRVNGTELPSPLISRTTYLVRVATNSNITISGLQTIDGVALSAGDRVLVKNQNSNQQNGVYVVASGAWTRASDLDTWAELQGYEVAATSGTRYGSMRFSPVGITSGTLNTTQFSWHAFGSTTANSENTSDQSSL